MKNLFSKIFVLALFLCSSFLFANPIEIGKNGVNFLDNYYSKGYNLGKSVETKANNLDIIISEVLNKQNGLVDGYIAVNKANDEILYFVDYLKESKEIKAIDFKNNTTDVINLQKENKFEKFIKIDLIKEIERVNFDPSSTMKFWGTSCGGSFSLEAGSCYKTCCYYVFWIESGCDVVGC